MGVVVNVYAGRRRAVHAVLVTFVVTAAMAMGVQAPSNAAKLVAPLAASTHVFGWGNNGSGQLADGTEHNNRFTPVPTNGLPANVQQVSVSDAFGLALLADGTVSAWGLNNFGQLGDGTISPINRNTPGPVLGLTGVTQVSAGHFYALARRSDGTVWAWGEDDNGELGDGNPASTFNATPKPVPGLTGISQVAAGNHSSLAMQSDGTVWAWGLNNHFQLGNNSTQNRSVPGTVPFLSGITQIANGGDHGLAMGGTNGNVWAWGLNDVGQLGTGDTVDGHLPHQLQSFLGVTQIAANRLHSLAVSATDHHVVAWGDNQRGELGDGTTTDHHFPTAIPLNGVVQIIAGTAGQSAAVRADGTLWTWGDNTFGELGTGTNLSFSTVPVQVTALARVTSVSAGFGFDVAVGLPSTVVVPNVRTEFRSTATNVLDEAGFAVNVELFVDGGCISIGRVASQTPVGGTVAPLGSTVTIRVGVLPDHRCP